MATRRKTPQVRKAPERAEVSLLMQSAESLGRMIGTLQRQLDDATRRLSHFGGAPAASRNAGAIPLRAKPRPKPKSANPRRDAATASNGRRRPHAAASKAGKNGAPAKSRSRKGTAKKSRTG